MIYGIGDYVIPLQKLTVAAPCVKMYDSEKESPRPSFPSFIRLTAI